MSRLSELLTPGAKLLIAELAQEYTYNEPMRLYFDDEKAVARKLGIEWDLPTENNFEQVRDRFRIEVSEAYRIGFVTALRILEESE